MVAMMLTIMLSAVPTMPAEECAEESIACCRRTMQNQPAPINAKITALEDAGEKPAMVPPITPRAMSPATKSTEQTAQYVADAGIHYAYDHGYYEAY